MRIMHAIAGGWIAVPKAAGAVAQQRGLLYQAQGFPGECRALPHGVVAGRISRLSRGEQAPLNLLDAQRQAFHGTIGGHDQHHDSQYAAGEHGYLLLAPECEQ